MVCGAVLGFAMIIAPSGAWAQNKADFYVSPEGNDAWSGTLREPNVDDGPFATLARAQQAVRKTASVQRAAIVELRGGTYWLEEPLEFTLEDTGYKGFPIVYRAAPGEQPIISGGQPLKGWSDMGKKWTISLPMPESGAPMQLFVGDGRRYRPRLPEVGTYFIAEELEPTEEVKDLGHNRFEHAAGQLAPNWRNIEDIEVLVTLPHTFGRFGIESVDKKRHVTLKGHTPGPEDRLRKGSRIILDNVASALQLPGQWYYDKKQERLIYNPKRREDSETTPAVVARIPYLLSIKGNGKGKKYVEHIEFQGITFAHTSYRLPEESRRYLRAELDIPAAVQLEAVRSIKFDNCRFKHLGGYAISFGNACKNNIVENCVLRDLGAGGIALGPRFTSVNAKEKPSKRVHQFVTSHNTISNCLIAEGGRIHPGGAGIWIGEAAYNTIANNEIVDFYGTGVFVGWKEGYRATHCHNNEIRANRIDRIGQGVLNEIGGIYTRSACIGTKIEQNEISRVKCFDRGGWGLYFDEATTGVTASQNIIYDSRSASFHIHSGRKNKLTNNIFANGGITQLQLTQREDHVSVMFERNLVYWKKGTLFAGNWSGDHFKIDRTIYWNPDPKQIHFVGHPFDVWQNKHKRDRRSAIADPGFADPKEGDFTAANVKALKAIGFRVIDQSKIGRSEDHRKKYPTGRAPRAFPGK